MGLPEATLIFPHQLFKNHPGLKKDRDIYLIETPLFFTGADCSFRFHKKKLLLHRASMQAYKQALISRGYRVHYVNHDQCPPTQTFLQQLGDNKIKTVFIADPVDRALATQLKESANNHSINLRIDPSPGFLTAETWLHDFFKDTAHFSMTRFYIAQRKRLNILIDSGKPAGNRWSFDPANRRRLPKNQKIPPVPRCPANQFIKEAQEYIENRFAHHPGDTENFFYPVTHADAKQWLHHFLKERLNWFGDFQDAMLKGEAFLFHSLLTPALNIGLLTPDQIVAETLAYAQRHSVPMNSLEGFIRQVIGWREFMRAVYVLRYSEEHAPNYFQHTRKLPRSFYDGTTGIEPVDVVIKRVVEHAYAHHIERLMVLGNFMLLCEIAPDDVYRWFMELFIDAYDWVMVPNVYGMSQYADGGRITTKPYISSSQYIRKMSDFTSGAWCEIWDGLFWRFVAKHHNLFACNPRMRVIAIQLDRMPEARRQQHLAIADHFLQSLEK